MGSLSRSLARARSLSGEALATGRILLSVKDYTVNNAVSPERFQAEFWAEVAKLVEAADAGSSMMVAPNFMLDDFKGFQSFFNLNCFEYIRFNSCLHCNELFDSCEAYLTSRLHIFRLLN